MKTKKLTKGTIGFIHLKYEPYFEPSIQNNQNCSYLIYKKKAENGYKTIRINIEPGNWTILGDSNSLTEEQIKLLGLDLEQYKSIKLELGICDENPYPDPKQKQPVCRDCADEDGTCPNYSGRVCDPSLREQQYNEAQSKVRKYITVYKED